MRWTRRHLRLPPVARSMGMALRLARGSNREREPRSPVATAASSTGCLHNKPDATLYHRNKVGLSFHRGAFPSLNDGADHDEDFVGCCLGGSGNRNGSTGIGCDIGPGSSGLSRSRRSYSRILVTEGIRRQRLELAI